MNLRALTLGSVVLAGMALLADAAEPAPRRHVGLTVRGGLLLRDGKPYRGIGANYFSLFYRTLKNPADTSYDDGLRELARSGIPFVRFMACGFWPVDWDLYLRDNDAYFERLDDVIRSAERARIGLIPSLFWNMATVPDIVGEPMDQLGNPESETIAFIRRYTREVVLRYRDSPAIWGWEFGNEYNLHVDLPNASKHRPPVWPKLKTASTRTARDELSSRAMLTAFTEFAKTVRAYDAHRVLITGNSLPRVCAYHNTREKSWKKDTAAQFETVLLRDNPDPYDVICVHVYGNKGQGEATSVAGLMSLLREISGRAGKPLFVGEFGAPQTLGAVGEEALFTEILNAVVAARVPLSAFWVFDHSGQDKDWNVTFENRRRYMLSLVAEANRRVSAGGGASPSSHSER